MTADAAPDKQLQEELNRLSLELQQINLQEKPPKALYHYTTAGGLRGIVQNNVLWASSVYHLNDVSEVAYGCELVRDVLRRKLPEIEKEGFPLGVAMLTEAIEAFAHPTEQFPNTYVCCFCQEGNVLGQWRAYGANGGYAIELCLLEKDLLQLAAPKGASLFFRKVIYDRDVQRNKLAFALEKYLEILRLVASRVTLEDGKALEKSGVGFVWFFTQVIAMNLLSYKHRAFEEEAEWRAVIRVEADPTKMMKFRENNLGIVPYVEIQPNTFDGCLPITSVICGPNRYPDLAKSAVRLLLDSAQMSTVPVNGSDVPARM
jgi:DUF2971 family protein